MIKKCMALVLVCSLLQIASIVALAKTNPESEAQNIAKLRTAILSLGVGPNAHIKIKLRDKTKVEGYLKEANDDHFVIADSRTKTDRSLTYPQVQSVHGNNLSTGAKIAIVAGAVTGAVLLTLFFLYHGHLTRGHG